MPFATLGGTELKVMEVRRADERAGGPVPTVNGELQGGVLWSRRGWDLDVLAETDGEAATVYTLADGQTVRAFAGDLPGASVNVKAEIKGDGYRRTRDGWYRVLSVLVRQAVAS